MECILFRNKNAVSNFLQQYLYWTKVQKILIANL